MPSLLSEDAVVECLTEMAHDIAEHGQSFSLEKNIAHVFATLACHSAIRAGKALTLEEMRSLLIQMDQFPMSSFCPHGRPVSVEIAKNELDRRFGRIN
jgi:DNA mismatch repair protein MutL